MIAAESMRAFFTQTKRGSLLTFEWVCTTGGDNARSHHFSRTMSMRGRLGSPPLQMLVRPIDDFGVDPDLDVVLTDHGGLRYDCVIRQLPGRGCDPWALPKILVHIPVIEDEHLSSCRMKIPRGSDYVADHFCDVDEMRRFQRGAHQHSDGYVPTITRERYERQ